MDHVPDLAAMRLLLQQWVAEDDRTPALAGRWAIDRRDDGRLLVGGLTHVSVGPVGARNCAHGP